jgi:hypothetical protein
LRQLLFFQTIFYHENDRKGGFGPINGTSIRKSLKPLGFRLQGDDKKTSESSQKTVRKGGNKHGFP